MTKKKIFSQFSSFQKTLENKLDNLIFWIVLGVIIGGRSVYVLFYNREYYQNNLLQILNLHGGGMAFVGGVVGVSFVLFLVIRKNKLTKNDFLCLADLICSFLPFGIMIGRIGNFLNQELIGKSITYLGKFGDFLNWFGFSYAYSSVDDMIRINNNFLESFFEGFLLLLCLQIVFWSSYRKNIKPGLISGLFMIGYGFFRFMLEFLRDSYSNEYWGFLSKSQYFMIAFIFVGITLLVNSLRKTGNIQ